MSATPLPDGCGAPAAASASARPLAPRQWWKAGSPARAAPVGTGYARLLGTGDEFVAEVPLGDDGGFRFFAAPGSWTLRVLAPNGLRAERSVQADNGQVTKVEVAL